MLSLMDADDWMLIDSGEFNGWLVMMAMILSLNDDYGNDSDNYGRLKLTENSLAD